jgi:hypothetical protein
MPGAWPKTDAKSAAVENHRKSLRQLLFHDFLIAIW